MLHSVPHSLIYASDRGRNDVVRLLLESGADANMRDNNGNSALIRATVRGHTSVVETLTKYIGKSNPER